MHAPVEPMAAPRRRLHVLSFNIQAGIDTRTYRDYLMQSWKHVLPHRERMRNLNRIADVLSLYDLVGLQEVDAGSLRSGFIGQTEYLAHRAGFPHWYQQVNRNIGAFAQHSNGLLTRLRPSHLTEHKLPGMPGRGAMLADFGTDGAGLRVCIVHLSLGRRSRQMQLRFVADLIGNHPHAIVMGDLNCGCDALEVRHLMRAAGLREPACDQKTFPSWRPMRRIDHILVSESLPIRNARVLDYSLSDHLPISLEVDLPPTVELRLPHRTINRPRDGIERLESEGLRAG
jgi:endonuclease/exonuclease/phosphatase family metal-dependent hydrolase